MLDITMGKRCKFYKFGIWFDCEWDPRPAWNLPQKRGNMVAQAGFPEKDEATICGGQRTSSTAMKSCLTYDFGSFTWKEAPFSLKTERFGAESVLLDNGTLMVFGGRDKSGDDLKSTEVFYGGSGSFRYGPEMPYPAFIPCALKVNSTHVLLAGGYNGNDELVSAYLLSVIDGKWTELPDMRQKRNRHSCGLVNGADVVVAGGWGDRDLSSVEMYSLKAEGWRDGPRLPVRARDMAAVQMGRTFVLTGGLVYDSIYMFDEENYSWIKRPEKLKKARDEHAAVLIPTKFKFCDH